MISYVIIAMERRNSMLTCHFDTCRTAQCPEDARHMEDWFPVMVRWLSCIPGNSDNCHDIYSNHTFGSIVNSYVDGGP